MADNNANASTPEPWRESDSRDLQAFVVQVRELVQAIVEDGRHIPENLRDDVAVAWLQARSDLDRLHDALDLQVVRDQVEHQQQLQVHGLTGASLRMKLRAWRARFFRFGHRMDRPWLRSVLRWADTILDSLTAAVPVPGVGSAAKEFKQSLENYLEDSAADEATREEDKSPGPPTST